MKRTRQRRVLYTMRILILLAALVSTTACTPTGGSPRAQNADSAAPAQKTATRTLPPVGVAVMDSAAVWCAEFPPTVPQLEAGRRVTIVLVAPAGVPGLGATIVRRREAACTTAFGQPRWDDYVAYDLALIDSLRPPAEHAPTATLVVASESHWTRGLGGVVRTDLDGDGVEEEARVCRADEGEHFSLWSPRPGGGREQRAHEYFDWGALVEPTCAAEESREASSSHADTVVTAARPDSADRLITATGIGPIRLGMTLDEARRALPTATFKRASDGEGVALVGVALAPDVTMKLFAGEDDADAPVDWSKRIEYIETFSSAFHTAAGVHPGSLMTDVERVHGRTKEITLSEIEAREYITFEAQPAWLTFRLDYSGIFEGESRKTTSYAPGAKIFSSAISSAA
jgi:hypothetical protein